jgi:hypothetical protein
VKRSVLAAELRFDGCPLTYVKGRGAGGAMLADDHAQLRRQSAEVRRNNNDHGSETHHEGQRSA